MYSETFGKRLKKAREDAGYSQKQIQEILGIEQSRLSYYENGKREPDIETIGKLADFYNVSVDWLFGLGKKNINN